MATQQNCDRFGKCIYHIRKIKNNNLTDFFFPLGVGVSVWSADVGVSVWSGRLLLLNFFIDRLSLSFSLLLSCLFLVEETPDTSGVSVGERGRGLNLQPAVIWYSTMFNFLVSLCPPLTQSIAAEA